MSKQELFYKVVQKDHEGNWRSAFVTGKLSLVYKEKKWTYPVIKNSKIFVFQDIYCAISFGKVIKLDPIIIFECLAKKPEEIAYVCNTRYVLENAKKFWQSPSLLGRGPDISLSPPGSMTASAIKLIKIYGT